MYAKKSCNKRGFTLVELLVVIGVIGALIAILMPVLSRARRAAIQIQCGSNLRQLMTMCIMYASENQGTFPDLHNSDNSWHYLDPVYGTSTAPYQASKNSLATGDPAWDNQYLDSVARYPNIMAIGGVDYLLGRYGKVNKAMLNSQQPRAMATVYCPSNPDANAVGNWMQHPVDYVNVNGTSKMVASNAISLNYCYYGNNTRWIASNCTSWDFGVLIGGTTWKQGPIVSRTQGQLTFPGRMTDKPKYKLMWSDIIQSRQPTAGATALFTYATANHMVGREQVSGQFPYGMKDGANCAYSDGHVEWKPAAYMAPPTAMSYLRIDGGGGVMQQYYIPRD